MIGLHETMSAPRAFALGDIVGLDEEREIDGKRATRLLRTRSEMTARLMDFEVRELMQRPVQLLPAEPGTRFCHVVVDYDEPGVWTEPVIAWALCFDGEVRPMTPQGVNDSMGPANEGHFVQMPDGSICGVGAYTEPCSFKSAEEMLAYRISQRDRRRAEAAANKKEQAHDKDA